ncbi:hypothetical protein P167DRAFT_385970 [Morchella conica CCBAS932]|uniref:Uncharacterized protein n=1 Tax=Morchella conica CCBAS932 TaxID=1392247 RepID=A0A3N4KEP0_9PEZI|nr:hypothetical protein P167DRAFT_385970 [Morchella conica CCBAS932]
MESSWAWAARVGAAVVRRSFAMRGVGAKGEGRVARRMRLEFWEVRRRWMVIVVDIVVVGVGGVWRVMVMGRVERGASVVKSVGGGGGGDESAASLAVRRRRETAFLSVGRRGGSGRRAAQKMVVGGRVSAICGWQYLFLGDSCGDVEMRCGSIGVWAALRLRVKRLYPAATPDMAALGRGACGGGGIGNWEVSVLCCVVLCCVVLCCVCVCLCCVRGQWVDRK